MQDSERGPICSLLEKLGRVGLICEAKMSLPLLSPNLNPRAESTDPVTGRTRQPDGLGVGLSAGTPGTAEAGPS